MKAPLELQKIAAATMKNAYAPYSKFLVGAAVQGSSGKIYAGCNVENAAFGTTLCAETNAIGSLVANGEHIIEEILIITNHSTLCPPCGICRQQIYEFATPQTLIHLCNLKKHYQRYTIDELLPLAFNAKNMESP